MTLKDKLQEEIDNGDLSVKYVLSRLLSCLSEEVLEDIVEAEFPYLKEERVESSYVFRNQAEADGYFASNPPPRNYCLECGDDFEWYQHNCESVTDYENYGCKKCDDKCIFCRD